MHRKRLFIVIIIVIGSIWLFLMVYDGNLVEFQSYTIKMYLSKPQCPIAPEFENLRFTTSRSDGLGAQLKARMASIAFVNKHSEYSFYYTPLKGFSHDVNMSDMDTFINIGFGQLQTEIFDDGSGCLPILDVQDIINENPSYYYDNITLHSFRSKYHQNKKDILTVYNDSSFNFNVAIHIRRGDIIGVNGYRLLSNTYYIQIMKYIINNIKIKKNKIIFNIFSENKFNINKFSKTVKSVFGKRSKTIFVKYYIETSLKETIHSLILADALILSKSAFSFIPALLSISSYIYYAETSLFHPQNNWIVVHQMTDINVYDKHWDITLYQKWWNNHNCSTKYMKQITNDLIIYENINCKTILSLESMYIQKLNQSIMNYHK